MLLNLNSHKNKLPPNKFLNWIFLNNNRLLESPSWKRKSKLIICCEQSCWNLIENLLKSSQKIFRIVTSFIQSNLFLSNKPEVQLTLPAFTVVYFVFSSVKKIHENKNWCHYTQSAFWWRLLFILSLNRRSFGNRFKNMDSVRKCIEWLHNFFGGIGFQKFYWGRGFQCLISEK